MQALQRMSATQRLGQQTAKYRELIDIAEEVVGCARSALTEPRKAPGKGLLCDLTVAGLRDEIGHYCGLADRVSSAFERAIEARWIGNRISTAPADRASAEEGVRVAYRAVGLAPPRIVWHDGPVSLATSWASASSRVDANASDIIVAASNHEAVQRLNTHSDRRVTSLRSRYGRDLSSAASAAMRTAVKAAPRILEDSFGAAQGSAKGRR